VPDDSYHDSVVDLSVKNNAHTVAYDLICHRGPERRLKVLDVGCASGLFGAALRRAGHEVWGVEQSPQAQAARDRLDHVVAGSVEDFLRSPEAAAEFDVVSFVDVLEHLVAPEAVLRQCKVLLRPDGAIVASLPNVAHLAVRVMLLEGRWEYADLGLLDRTHLRFFTRESIVELMEGAGFSVEEMQTVVVPVAHAGISVDPRLLRKVSRLVRDDDAEVFQYVVRAVPVERRVPAPAAAPVRRAGRPAPKVLCVEAQADSSIGEIRFRTPLTTWSARGAGEFRLISMGAIDHRQMRWSDIVIFQREAPPPIFELASDLKRLGRRVIFELDDLLTHVPPFLTTHAHSVASRADLERMMRLADAVSVTTPRLQQKMSRLNRRVLVVPNCSAPTLITARHDEAGPATLLLASSDTVRVDFVAGALARLCADSTTPVRIVAIGPPGDHLARASIPVERHPLMSHEEFKLFVASLDNAIGLIPLDGSEFSGCKSAIKFVDYALAGVPSICSAVSPYTDVVTDGTTGRLVANTESDWHAAIRDLSGSAETRQRLAGAARTLCLDRFAVDVAADAWDEVFARVLADSDSGVSRSAALYPALRRLARPSCYVNGFRIARREGVAGIVSRLRLYLGGG
jgi:2-polyprenyl-3-methyl-5-hydroxy-6-metoxy-1,4-benzoquinol methylase